MRRAVLTLSGTAVGLVALFSYKTHGPGAAPVAEPSTPAAHITSAPPTTSASPSTSKAPAKKATPKTPTAPATAQRSTPTSAKTTPAPTKAAPTTAPPKPSGTFAGSDVSTQFGPVQVSITVTNGKITASSDVQPPDDSIAANAVQQLNSEVVQAQSANIQAVSGATYTSQGYIQSLQQAVNKAGL